MNGIPSTLKHPKSLAALGILLIVIFFSYMMSASLRHSDEDWHASLHKDIVLEQQALSKMLALSVDSMRQQVELITANTALAELMQQWSRAEDRATRAALKTRFDAQMTPYRRAIETSNVDYLAIYAPGEASPLFEYGQPSERSNRSASLRDDTPDSASPIIHEDLGLNQRVTGYFDVPGAERARQGRIVISDSLIDNFYALSKTLDLVVTPVVAPSSWVGQSPAEWRVADESNEQARALLSRLEGQSERQVSLGERIYYAAVVPLGTAGNLHVIVAEDITARAEMHRWHYLQSIGRWCIGMLLAACGLLILLVAHGRSTRRQMSQTQQSLERQVKALRALNEVSANRKLELDKRISHALAIGCEFLNLPIGIVSRINGDDYIVRFQCSPEGALKGGERFSLTDTYCGITLEQDGMLAFSDVEQTTYLDHPCHRIMQVKAYIGVPLWVGGMRYGTVNFSSPSVRAFEMTSLDEEFLLALSRWIGTALHTHHEEQQRSELMARMGKVSQHLPGMIYQFREDVDGHTSFPYVSDGIKDVYGVTPEDVRFDASAAFTPIHEEDLAAVIDSITRSREQLVPWSIDYRIRGDAGEVRWMRGSSTPEREPDNATTWYGFIYDVTDQKLAEEALLQSRQRLEALIEASVNVAFIAMDLDGDITLFNSGAQNLFGYREDEALGRSAQSLLLLSNEVDAYHEQLCDELNISVSKQHVLVEKARRDGEETREWNCRTRTGSDITVSLVLTAIKDQQGQPVGYLAIGQDISERKRIERMKSEFVSTISHELRTPLTSISGSLGLVTGGALGELPEQTKSMLDIAHKNAKRLNVLINDLLDMDKLVAGKMRFDIEVQPLAPLLEQALLANEAYATQFGVTLDLELDEPCHVAVDADRFQQIMANFLSNAIKFSPEGDRIIVRARPSSLGVRVEIEDHGPGISESFKSKIFDKFSQADSSDTKKKGGTGLGLAISRELAYRMNGQVGFDSEEGAGSVFYVDLPRVESSSAHDVVKDAGDLRPSVLIVEDDTDVAGLLSDLIERWGYRATVAHTGKAALELLQLQQFDAMTLDMILPDFTGTTLMQRLRADERYHDLPVIVISAHMANGSLQLTRGVKALDWLNKPLDETRLLSVLRKAMGNGTHRGRILHVEDDHDLHHVIATMCRRVADLDAAPDLATARTLLSEQDYDLVLLDLGLPDGSGWELMPLIQQKANVPPVLVLSGSEVTAEQQSRVYGAVAKSRISNEAFVNVLRKALNEGQAGGGLND
ncbi:response regulator [Larsenimonas suaedae]|uniref:histidine kinase n=1 Tax=Larsenimonas suaedae TaxID=1851019 RepID=A0ABU1GSW6_9GAMM|nr:response regulator [Larsenimonas suaedae]MCM2972089.1 response regulator [Larsenimonas suaedae]MDR5895117.1 response regulator [Larsenimonas suaedae]